MSLDYPNRENWLAVRLAQRNEIPEMVFYPFTAAPYNEKRNAAKRLLGATGRQRRINRKLVTKLMKHESK